MNSCLIVVVLELDCSCLEDDELIMGEYGRCLKQLWSSWNKTFEISGRIKEAQIRRNQLKQLEANYRVPLPIVSVSRRKWKQHTDLMSKST